MFGIAFLIVCIYGALIWWMDKKFARLRAIDLPPVLNGVRFSIIIPCRNEADNIQPCIDGILAQTYNASHVEIILIDDHSEDNSWQIMERLAQNHENIHTHRLSDQLGKKAALKTGIDNARFEWIVTRDADTGTGKDWLAGINANIERRPDKKLWILPVVSSTVESFLQKCFSIEFLSLVASGLASAAGAKPIMANGANLVFQRSVFIEMGGYSSHEHISSGDDLFLLMAVNKSHKDSIGVSAQKGVIATTPMPNMVSDWFSQRIRWGGKFKAYGYSFASIVGWLVVLTNVLLLGGIVWGIFHPEYWSMVGFAWVIKILPEYIFLQNASDQLQLEKAMPSFIIVAILNPFILVLTFVLSLFTKPSWKGRKVIR